ncbi:MAG: hypothetical protein AAB074_16420 [Planctomycetota bacterium]
MSEVLGFWVAAALTLFMFSFLYKDNPFYRMGENLFVGVTIGYSIVILYFESWLPKVWRVIHPEAGVWFENREWWVLIFPVTLGVLVLTRFIPKWAWMSRWTFAFIVGYASGLAIPATLTTSIQKQAAGTVQPLLTRTPDLEGAEADARGAEAAADEAARKDPTSEDAREARVRAEELRQKAEAARGAGEAAEDAVSVAEWNEARKPVVAKAIVPLVELAAIVEAKAPATSDQISKAKAGQEGAAKEAAAARKSADDEAKTAQELGAAAGKARAEADALWAARGKTKESGDAARAALETARVEARKAAIAGKRAARAGRLALEAEKRSAAVAELAAIILSGAAATDDQAAKALNDRVAATKSALDASQAAIATRIGAWDAASRKEYMLLTFYRDVSALILFVGVLSVLVYFFFSIEHRGPVSKISRLGVWFLMVYFGASYGYTVMGRLSLLYGRMSYLLDASDPKQAWCATPILLVIIIGGLVFLHFKNKGQEPAA